MLLQGRQPIAASAASVPLATTGLTRAPFLPDLPAVAELLPGSAATQRHAFVASGKTPAPILER